VIDLVAHTFVQAPKVSCRALVNLPHGRFLSEGFLLEATLVDASGAKLDTLQRKVAAHRLSGWTKQQIGLSQMAVEWEHTIPNASASQLSIMLKIQSHQGEVLQTLSQPVKSSGVLSEPTEESAAGQNGTFGGNLSGSERVIPEESIVGGFDEGKVQSKGLLSWLWR
jgi:hypothetical protein